MIGLHEIHKSFHQHAVEYDKYAKIQQEIGRRLFNRLDYINIASGNILDLGCGTGQFSRALRHKYPRANIVAIDFAQNMLIHSKKKHTWRHKWQLIAANMMQLPFNYESFDLVFANQVIHWSHALPDLFNEINRVMKNNGCFMFTTLGPDTFKEIQKAWQHDTNTYMHVNEFHDMHNIGDTLLKTKFIDPVMDMEILTARYKSIKDLHVSLKKQGVRNMHQQRNSGLTGKTAYMSFIDKYNTMRIDNKYPLTYEVIYGQAWKSHRLMNQNNTEIRIPISNIKRS